MQNKNVTVTSSHTPPIPPGTPSIKTPLINIFEKYDFIFIILFVFL